MSILTRNDAASHNAVIYGRRAWSILIYSSAPQTYILIYKYIYMYLSNTYMFVYKYMSLYELKYGTYLVRIQYSWLIQY